MSSSFAARRKARIIAQEDGDEDEPGQAQSHAVDAMNKPSTGPNPETLSLSRSSSKTKKKKSSRISFGHGGTSMTEDDDAAATPIFTPKKSNLSRQAISNNALRKSLASNTTPLRQSLDDRPSYSAEHLNELKSSTPSTPKILDPASTDEENSALDLAAKFGSDLSVYASSSAIPTNAEIREKKARRAQLAKEEEYINLHGGGSDESDDDDDNRNEITLRSQKDYPETRLVREDEDMAEGFEDYVDDGRIALGRKAEQEQRRKQKSEMETLINEAEGGGGGGGGSSSNETDESEVERLQAFEGTQTAAGSPPPAPPSPVSLS